MSIVLQLSKKYKTVLDKYRINTPLRLAHFFAQVYSESKCKAVRESLYYSTIANARKTFKTPFKGKSDAFVQSYLKNSVKMANYVYANRMGNGSESSGDGYKNRGGGWLQHTGANEMKILEARTGIAFSKNPDLLLEEPNAIIAAIDYWNRLGLSNIADKDSNLKITSDIILDQISDLINIGKSTQTIGDANGYKERKENLIAFKKIFV